MTKVKKRPSLGGYDEGMEDKPEILSLGLIELSELIEQKLDNKPNVRDKFIWKAWVKDVNSLVEIYNEKCGFKAYCHVH